MTGTDQDIALRPASHLPRLITIAELMRNGGFLVPFRS